MPNLTSVALSLTEIWSESQNLRSRSRNPGHDPFDPILHFCLVPLRIVLSANLVSLALSVMEIWRGSQNLKSRSRNPGHAPFDPILHFLLSTTEDRFAC